MEEINLDNLDAFSLAGDSWRVAGNVYANRKQAGAMAVTEGKGVLVGSAPAGNAGVVEISTKWEHQQMDLELDFMLSAGAEGYIVFQNQYAVQL